MGSVLLYLANIACGGARSVFCKKNGRHGGDLPLFLLVNTFFSFLLFLIVSLVKRTFLPSVALWGLLYGVLFLLSTWSGTVALKKGPMGTTCAIASLSLVIPFLWGVTLWHEPFSFLSVFGVAMIFPAAWWMNGKSEKEASYEKDWWLYTLLAFLSNGFCSVVQKAQQLSAPGEGSETFLLTAMAVNVLTFGISCLIPRNGAAAERESRQAALVFGAGAGLAGGACNLLTMLMAGSRDSSVLFPILSVLNIAAALLCGRLFFREHLRKIQLCGMAAAAAAILCIRLG